MNLKTTIKQAVGAAFASRFLLPIVRHSSLDAINVIYYHHVGDPAPHYKAFYNGCTAAKFAARSGVLEPGLRLFTVK